MAACIPRAGFPSPGVVAALLSPTCALHEGGRWAGCSPTHPGQGSPRRALPVRGRDLLGLCRSTRRIRIADRSWWGARVYVDLHAPWCESPYLAQPRIETRTGHGAPPTGSTHSGHRAGNRRCGSWVRCQVCCVQLSTRLQASRVHAKDYETRDEPSK